MGGKDVIALFYMIDECFKGRFMYILLWVFVVVVYKLLVRVFAVSSQDFI